MTGNNPAGSRDLAENLPVLVAACLAGDEAAAQCFVERYQQRVFALCWRMLGQREDAEDAAQDTFVRALRNLDQWDAVRPIEPWLLTIAANRCRTVIAKRRRWPMELPLLEAEPQNGTGDLQRARQLAEEVYRALGNIKQQYAQAFRLFHEEELSYGQIAEALDCPMGTVKTWVHRARREIALELTRRGVIETRSNVNQPIENLSGKSRVAQSVAR